MVVLDNPKLNQLKRTTSYTDLHTNKKKPSRFTQVNTILYKTNTQGVSAEQHYQELCEQIILEKQRDVCENRVSSPISFISLLKIDCYCNLISLQ